MPQLRHLVNHTLPASVVDKALAHGLSMDRIKATINRWGPLAERVILEDLIPLLEGSLAQPAETAKSK